MPRSLSSGLADHIAGSELTLTWCLKLKRPDGTIACFSENKSDMTIDLGDGDGAQTYPAGNILSFAAVSQSLALEDMDETEVRGAFQDGALTRADIVAGLWRHAAATLFRVDRTALGDGAILEMTGRAGRWEVEDFGWTCEILGMKAAYHRPIGKVVQQYCRAQFGSTAGRDFCGRVLAPEDWQATTYALGDFVRNPSFDDRDYKCIAAGNAGTGSPPAAPSFDATIGNETVDGGVTWKALRAVQVTGTVATVVDAFTLTLTGFTLAEYPDSWFAYGKIAFSSGDNAGVTRSVLGWLSATGRLTLVEPLPFDPAAGDAFTLTAGCNLTLDQGVNSCEAHDQVDPAPGKGGFRGEPRVVGISEKVEIQR